MELTYDMETGGLELGELSTLGLVTGGQPKNNIAVEREIPRVAIIGIGPIVLMSMLHDMEEAGIIVIEEFEEGYRGLEASRITFDDIVMQPEITYSNERKRSGKRKNTNPYQQTMKRGR